MEKSIRRGEIYFYDYGINPGSIQSGRRPVLVIEADDFNKRAPTVIVAAITSANKKAYMPSHIDLGENFGLAKPSMILLEQLRTINKSELEEYVGFIDDEDIWKRINFGIKKAFGLWIYKRSKTGNVECLCPKCLKDYLNANCYIVRRVDPYNSEKDNCTKCNGLGYDYFVFDKRSVCDSEQNVRFKNSHI